MIPRFTGHALHSRRVAVAQWWLANAGLVMVVAGLVLMPHTMFETPARVIVAAGGVVSAAAAYAFVYNIWCTIDGPPGRRIAARDTELPTTVSVLRRATR